MSTLVRRLGEEIEREGKKWRVVRITKQTSLFEDLKGQTEVVDEHLLQLKSSEGEIDFEVLSSERLSYDGPYSQIKAPEPIVWRKD